MSSPWTRRRFLTAATAGVGGLALVSTTGADDHTPSFALEQDGECYPVVPLSGEAPVEELYRWGRDILSWSSEGTRELQRSETSLLFLYRGPLGLSLVVVHDRGDDETPGGTASFRFEGVPEDAEWVVKDDLYELSTNVDQWRINGTLLEANESTVTNDIPTVNESTLDNETASADGNTTASNVTGGNATVDDAALDSVTTGNASVANVTDYDTRTDEIDWWWTEGRTDGGALRGLGVDGLVLRIEPSFNDAASVSEDSLEDEDTNRGEITSWQLLTGDRDDPDRTELDLDEPILLRTGSCEMSGQAGTSTPTDSTPEEEATDADSTPEEEATDTPADERETADTPAGEEATDTPDDGEEEATEN